jgi:hypothetical protein
MIFRQSNRVLLGSGRKSKLQGSDVGKGGGAESGKENTG